MADRPKIVDKNVTASMREDFLEIRKLIDDDEEEDKTQPYKTKYRALDILKRMLESLSSNDNIETDNRKIDAKLAVIYMFMGMAYIKTDELRSAEDSFTKCIDILNREDVQPQTVLILINALNNLGILWSRRDQPAKAKVFLERAEITYKEYKQKHNEPPLGIETWFNIEDLQDTPAQELLEQDHTRTLYYLAQIYGSLEKYFESAIYCHATLCRQLEYKDLDSIDWALNAATLSQFFMEKEAFALAKHHLGAASYILQKHKESLEKNEKNDDEETLAANWERFNHRSADVARCWAKYGIVLMSSSRERLIEQTEDEDKDKKSTENANNVDEIPSNMTNLKFTLIEKEIEKIVENVTDKYLLDFDDAAVVFKNTKTWLDDAAKFYTLENHASDHVEVVQDISRAYKNLAFFEEDEGRRAKMHKRRIDALENVIKQLNPKYYLRACREIWIELGEIYSELRDIKFERLRNIESKPPMYLINKVNHLTKEAIRYYELFIDSLKEYENAQGVKKFPEEMIRPSLCCYFAIARLYSVCLSNDKEKQMENTKKSLDAYTFLINYCEKDTKARELMIEELNICKDLVKLLPLKLAKLSTQQVTSN